MSDIILNADNINQEILNNNIKAGNSYIINYDNTNYNNLRTFIKTVNNISDTINIHLNLSSASLTIENLINIFSDDVSNLNINIDLSNTKIINSIKDILILIQIINSFLSCKEIYLSNTLDINSLYLNILLYLINDKTIIIINKDIYKYTSKLIINIVNITDMYTCIDIFNNISAELERDSNSKLYINFDSNILNMNNIIINNKKIEFNYNLLITITYPNNPNFIISDNINKFKNENNNLIIEILILYYVSFINESFSLTIDSIELTENDIYNIKNILYRGRDSITSLDIINSNLDSSKLYKLFGYFINNPINFSSKLTKINFINNPQLLLNKNDINILKTCISNPYNIIISLNLFNSINLTDIDILYLLETFPSNKYLLKYNIGDLLYNNLNNIPININQKTIEPFTNSNNCNFYWIILIIIIIIIIIKLN